MARIVRSLSEQDVTLLRINRDRAARIFLDENPGIKMEFRDPLDDLYTAVATHLSLYGEIEEREKLARGLRETYENILANPSEQASSRPVLGEPDNPIPMGHSIEQQLKYASNQLGDETHGLKDGATAKVTEEPEDNSPGIFREPFYAHRGEQVLAQLLDPIIELAKEAEKAVAKAEMLAADPDAKPSSVEAAFAAVGGYEAAIGRSLDSLEGKLVNRLNHQFKSDNINVPDHTIVQYAERALNNLKTPKQIDGFNHSVNNMKLVELRYMNDLRHNGYSSQRYNNDIVEDDVNYDISPRP